MLRKKRVLLRKRKKYIKNRNIFVSKTGKKIVMKSSWEVKTAQYLEKHNIKFDYEAVIFKTSVGKYIPDFYIEKNNPFAKDKNKNSFIEVKGRWFGKSKTKVEQFKLLYPGIELIVLMKEDLKKSGIL